MMTISATLPVVHDTIAGFDGNGYSGNSFMIGKKLASSYATCYNNSPEVMVTIVFASPLLSREDFLNGGADQVLLACIVVAGVETLNHPKLSPLCAVEGVKRL
jgi:hypothetical protein